MKLHSSIVCAGIAALGISLLWMYSRRPEPSYDGKPASYWFDHFSDVYPGTQESCAAFKVLGSNAVPFLVRILEKKPSRLGKLCDEHLCGNSSLSFRVPGWLRNQMPSAWEDENRRETAASLIGEIGPKAVAAIGPLITTLEAQEERKKLSNEAYMAQRLQSEVFTALKSMGEQGVIALPKYLNYLESDDDEWRATGAELVGSIGPKAKVAVPLLLEAMGRTNEWLRFSAAVALWKVDFQTNTALAVFATELSSKSGYNRIWSLRYLSEMGLSARGASPLVRECLGDSLLEVREQAKKTLRAIELETFIQPACPASK